MLVEGQSRGGVKLLSVDTKNAVAKFDNHGTLQVVRICSTPELTVVAALKNQAGAPSPAHPAAAMAKAPGQAPTAGSSSAGAEGFNPGFLPIAVSSRNSSTASGGGATGATAGTAVTDTTTVGTTVTGIETANGSTAGTPATSDPLSWAKSTWWYTGSQDVEQARAETADAVHSGALPPYPLTPLTPPGTPPELIGPGQAFFNHFVPLNQEKVKVGGTFTP
jgi:hypothetical protein